MTFPWLAMDPGVLQPGPAWRWRIGGISVYYSIPPANIGIETSRAMPPANSGTETDTYFSVSPFHDQNDPVPSIYSLIVTRQSSRSWQFSHSGSSYAVQHTLQAFYAAAI